jgi:hypothetical protein
LELAAFVEGGARANELNKNGIEVKVTHMRVYRSPTAIQNLPHQFNGNETRAILDTWTCLPNPETVFEVIEDFDTYKDTLNVYRDTNDKNRLNVVAHPDIVNQLRIFASLIQFKL